MTTINIMTKEINGKYDNEATTIMKNAQAVGKEDEGKVYASIPIRLLAIDPSYQRVEYTSESKINDLARHFDPHLMEAPKVSLHAEEGKFYTVDGYHRTEVYKILGKSDITCEILQGLSNDPEKRQIQEAEIFRKQQKWTEKLTPVSLHKANMKCGDKPSIELEELVKSYGFKYRTNGNRGRCQKRTLTGFRTALDVVRSYGKEMLEDIFDVIIGAKWDGETSGLGDITITTLRNMFYYNPETREHKDEIINIMKELTPRLFEAKARARYDKRASKVATSLYLEDLLAEKIQLDKNIHSKYNVA